jgi:hypothetical protein
MATSPDAKVIDRESLKTSLEARFLAKQKAGGAFNAYKATRFIPGGTMLDGLQGDMGYSQKSREYTIEPGFTTSIDTQQDNFNEKALNYIDSQPGFNTKRYFR